MPFFPGAHDLLVIRALRLLCASRIFKRGRFVREGNVPLAAIGSSRHKIIAFLAR